MLRLPPFRSEDGSQRRRKKFADADLQCDQATGDEADAKVEELTR